MSQVEVGGAEWVGLVKHLFSVDMGGIELPSVNISLPQLEAMGGNRSALTASLCFSGGGAFLVYILTGLDCLSREGRSFPSASRPRMGGGGAEVWFCSLLIDCCSEPQLGCPIMSDWTAMLLQGPLDSTLVGGERLAAAIPCRSFRTLTSRQLSDSAMPCTVGLEPTSSTSCFGSRPLIGP